MHSLPFRSKRGSREFGHRLHLIHCHQTTDGIAKPVRSDEDNDNAIHRLLVCGCEDEPYGTLHILLPTSLIVEPSVGQKADVLDRPQTETTTPSVRHTDIGIQSNLADVCICGTSCCRLHRLPASRRASRPFRRMCHKHEAWLRASLPRPSRLGRGELLGLQGHGRFHAAAYREPFRADCEKRNTRRSQSVSTGNCKHPGDVLSWPIQMTNCAGRASGVPSQQWLPIPANPYFHSSQFVSAASESSTSPIQIQSSVAMSYGMNHAFS